MVNIDKNVYRTVNQKIVFDTYCYYKCGFKDENLVMFSIAEKQSDNFLGSYISVGFYNNLETRSILKINFEKIIYNLFKLNKNNIKQVILRLYKKIDYSSKKLLKTNKLLKYQEIVKDWSLNFVNWRRYDLNKNWIKEGADENKVSKNLKIVQETSEFLEIDLTEYYNNYTQNNYGILIFSESDFFSFYTSNLKSEFESRPELFFIK
jgi:hypothetical protein